MIFVNFKTYIESTGDKAVYLARIINGVAKEFGVDIVSCPQAVDMEDIAATGSSVWAQHVDSNDQGRATGMFPASVALEAGASGTLLNHSEHKLEFNELVSTVKVCKEIGLETLIFADGLAELEKVIELHPNYVSYEPPELVGSTKVSVTQAKPEVISKAANLSKEADIPLIVGAGIHSREDVVKSLELGADGIAVATNIVKAQDQKSELINLVKGFK